MPVGISNVAHTLRDQLACTKFPIALSHCQQLIAAALGYRTFASCQAAQKKSDEVTDLLNVRHVLIDQALLSERAHGLEIQTPPWELLPLVTRSFEERLPGTNIYRSLDEMEGNLHDLVSAQVLNNDNVCSVMAMTNSNGLQDVYVELELCLDDRSTENTLDLNAHVQVVMNIDEERVYSGHRITVPSIIHIACLGQLCFGEVSVEVTPAQMDYADDQEYEFDPPRRSISDALAELLGIHIDDLGDLVSVEPQALEGHEDMIYGYIFDFEGLATPEQDELIRKRHGSLQINVDASFFEGVVNEDWPN